MTFGEMSAHSAVAITNNAATGINGPDNNADLGVGGVQGYSHNTSYYGAENIKFIQWK